MPSLIALLIIAFALVFFAGKKIPSLVRKLAKELREIKFTGDNGYVEVDR